MLGKKKNHPAPPTILHSARSGPSSQGTRELEQIWNIEGQLFRLYVSHNPESGYTQVRSYRFSSQEGRYSTSNPYLNGDESFVANISEDPEDWGAFQDALQTLAHSVSRILHVGN